MVVAVAIIFLMLVGATGAQYPGARIAMVSDWSHHHVLFSQPNSFGTAWRLQGEPRYWQQIFRRNARIHGPVELGISGENSGFGGFDRRNGQTPKGFGRDWAQSLGANASTGAPIIERQLVARVSREIYIRRQCHSELPK